MKWLLVFLLPLCTVAQSLKPGVYRDLKPDKPIVLDTGSYIFIHLEMKNLGKGIWLDGRKARQLEISHCRFEGTGSDTAVVAGGHVTIHHSVFHSIASAVLYQGAATGSLVLFRNQFENNRIAISLQKKDSLRAAQISFSLKCNEFINHPSPGSPGRIGLQIGKGVKIGYPEAGFFRFDALGSEGRNFYDAFSYPNGNLWPTLQPDRTLRTVVHGMWADIQHPDSTLAWPNSPNWICLDNQSGSEITYHRYDNEFVGWGKAISGPVTFRAADSQRKLRLQAGKVTDSCAYLPLQPKGQVNARVCEQLLDEQPFLLPTIWTRTEGNACKAPPTDGNTFLGEPEPMAEIGHLRIRLWLPAGVKQAVLQYLDKDGTTVLQNNPIEGSFWKEAIVDMHYTEAGVYSYRLMVNGIPGIAKKLVVTH